MLASFFFHIGQRDMCVSNVFELFSCFLNARRILVRMSFKSSCTILSVRGYYWQLRGFHTWNVGELVSLGQRHTNGYNEPIHYSLINRLRGVCKVCEKEPKGKRYLEANARDKKRAVRRA